MLSQQQARESQHQVAAPAKDARHFLSLLDQLVDLLVQLSRMKDLVKIQYELTYTHTYTQTHTTTNIYFTFAVNIRKEGAGQTGAR